jgi:hypothetical protein
MTSFSNWSKNWNWRNLESVAQHQSLNIFWSWMFLEINRFMIFRMIRFSWSWIDFSEMTSDSSMISSSPVHRIDRELFHDLGLPIAAQTKVKWDELHSKVSVNMPVSADNCIYHICPFKSMIVSHWLIRQPLFIQVYVVIAGDVRRFCTIVSVFATFNSLKLLWTS